MTLLLASTLPCPTATDHTIWRWEFMCFQLRRLRKLSPRAPHACLSIQALPPHKCSQTNSHPTALTPTVQHLRPQAQDLEPERPVSYLQSAAINPIKLLKMDAIAVRTTRLHGNRHFGSSLLLLLLFIIVVVLLEVLCTFARARVCARACMCFYGVVASHHVYSQERVRDGGICPRVGPEGVHSHRAFSGWLKIFA